MYFKDKPDEKLGCAQYANQAFCNTGQEPYHLERLGNNNDNLLEEALQMQNLLTPCCNVYNYKLLKFLTNCMLK